MAGAEQEDAAAAGAGLLQLITARWISQALSAAARVGLPDAIGDEPLAPAEVARAVGADTRAVHRLLRALASVGVFVEDARGRFAHTPRSHLLRSGVPGSLRGMALYQGSEVSLRAWSDLPQSVRTGEPAFRRLYGKGFFEYLQGAPDEAQDFDDAMHGISSAEIPAIVEAYDFGKLGVLVDVGGGDGTLLRAILERHPGVRGVLQDLEEVVGRARKRLQSSPFGERIELVAGSFFDAVPSGGDAYLLKHILHDWSDERSEQILLCCHRAMPRGAVLLVVDCVIPPGNDPHFAKFLDLEMIAVTDGGRERTEEEFRELLARSGFELSRIVPTAGPVSILEARPA